jgi:hypothetical protein
MYDKSDKRRLHWLIDEYLSGNINESVFCDEFYFSYDLELDRQTLSEIEQRIFNELSKVTSRFSEFEEDHKLDSRAFSTANELREKILESQENLKER